MEEKWMVTLLSLQPALQTFSRLNFFAPESFHPFHPPNGPGLVSSNAIIKQCGFTPLQPSFFSLHALNMLPPCCDNTLHKLLHGVLSWLHLRHQPPPRSLLFLSFFWFSHRARAAEGAWTALSSLSSTLQWHGWVQRMQTCPRALPAHASADKDKPQPSPKWQSGGLILIRHSCLTPNGVFLLTW